jgi:SM-20-related protein
MPPASFFHNLFLFVREGFFYPSTCAQIKSQMAKADSQKGTVVLPDGQGDAVDEEVRKVLTVKAEESVTRMIWDALWNLKPSLEDHFHIHLRGCEPPVFLRYGKGAFYRPHTDGQPDSLSSTRNRRVSVVVFLNERSDDPSKEAYGGGDLTFYGLLDGPTWEKCPFPLEADQGLLIAFRSNTTHEVRPVTFGQRFTVVSWLGE